MDVRSNSVSTGHDANWNEKDRRKVTFPKKCSSLFQNVQRYSVEVIRCFGNGKNESFAKVMVFMISKSFHSLFKSIK